MHGSHHGHREVFKRKKMGDAKYNNNAFDFMEFIMHASVLIDAVSSLTKIIVGDGAQLGFVQTEVFLRSKKRLGECCDFEYFRYLRSICAIHPTETSRHKKIQTYESEVSPFILWGHGISRLRSDGAELYARIYANDETQKIKTLPIYLKEVFEYVTKNYLAINLLTEKLVDKFAPKIPKNSAAENLTEKI